MDVMVYGATEDPTAKLCPLGLPIEAMALRSPDRKMVPDLSTNRLLPCAWDCCVGAQRSQTATSSTPDIAPRGSDG
jgi:hypothetical protein